MRIELKDKDGFIPAARVLLRVNAAVDDYVEKWGVRPSAIAISFNTYIRLGQELSKEVMVRCSDRPPSLCGVGLFTSGTMPDDYLEVL